jgi:hypothetical protein
MDEELEQMISSSSTVALIYNPENLRVLRHNMTMPDMTGIGNIM